MENRNETEKRKVIMPNQLVTITKMNHITEIQHMDKMNHSASIKKLNKDEYVVLETGEIKEYNHFENRSDSYNSLRQTFKKLRYLINNNFCGRRNELFVTLTYEENMTDTSRLRIDMNRFTTALKKRYKKKTSVDYLSVVEPQERGAWHVHMLIRFNELDHIFIENADLAKLWGHGYVTIKRIKDVDNVGAYLTAYLADLELTDESCRVAALEKREIVEKEIDGETKKFIKGGRLHLYPPNMNFYRKSNGVLYPERLKMSYKNALKKVGSAKPHYVKTIDISTDTFENTITYEQYNLKR